MSAENNKFIWTKEWFRTSKSHARSEAVCRGKDFYIRIYKIKRGYKIRIGIHEGTYRHGRSMYMPIILQHSFVRLDFKKAMADSQAFVKSRAKSFQQNNSQPREKGGNGA